MSNTLSSCVNKNNVTNCVEHFRKMKGLTQQQLADSIGVSRQTISALEQGDYDPSVKTALKIAEILQVKVDQIFAISE